MDTKKRPKAPAKTQRGGQIAVQKISVSGACETKLGCVLSYLENAIRNFTSKIFFALRRFSVSAKDFLGFGPLLGYYRESQDY